MWAAVAVPAAALALLAAPPARAAIEITGYSVSPTTLQAGAHPNVTTSISFCDPAPVYCTAAQFSEDAKDLTLHLPAGLIGNPLAVPRCTNARFLADTCPDASQIGSVLTRVAFSAGSPPIPVTSAVYNVEPQGSELGRFGGDITMAGYDRIALPILASVRTAGDLGVDTVASGLPTQLISNDPPADIKISDMTLAFLGQAGSPPVPFMTNPTSCTPGIVSVDVNSYTDAAFAAATTSYQATNCGNLPFAPRVELTMGASGETGKYSSPPIRVVVTQLGGEAAIRATTITLPDIVRPNSAAVAAKICRAEQFAAGTCPPSSSIGQAVAQTPLLAQPLSGSLFMGQEPGQLGANLGVQLQGQVPIGLSGRVGFSGNRTVNRLDNGPDLPISRLELTFNGGQGGIMAAASDLCGAAPRADAAFVSHSGKAVTSTPVVNVEGCGPRPSLTVSKKRLTMTRGGVVKVNVSCRASGGDCAGTLSLVTAKKVRVASAAKTRRKKRNRLRRRKLKLGSARFAVPAGSRRAVRVKLSRTGRRAVLRLKRVRVRVRTRMGSTTTTHRLTVKAPKKKKGRKKRR